MKSDEEKCLAAGCSGYLTKPIDPDLLVATVSEALRVPGVEANDSEDADHAGAVVDEPRTDSIVSSLPIEDPEFQEIVAEFVDTLRLRIAAMRDALESATDAASGPNLKELARLAHWLKGAGRTAGFACLTDPTKRLGEAAKAGDAEAARAAITEIETLADRIVVDQRQESVSGGVV